MKHFTPELIRSLTPMFIALIGGIIGVTVIFNSEPAQWSSGMGLAGTALAGAAGLAQPSKSESTISDKDLKPISDKDLKPKSDQ